MRNENRMRMVLRAGVAWFVLSLALRLSPARCGFPSDPERGPPGGGVDRHRSGRGPQRHPRGLGRHCASRRRPRELFRPRGPHREAKAFHGGSDRLGQTTRRGDGGVRTVLGHRVHSACRTGSFFPGGRPREHRSVAGLIASLRFGRAGNALGAPLLQARSGPRRLESGEAEASGLIRGRSATDPVLKRFTSEKRWSWNPTGTTPGAPAALADEPHLEGAHLESLQDRNYHGLR